MSNLKQVRKRSYLWCVIDNHCSASRGGSLLWDLQVQLSLLVKHDWFYCQWNTQRFVVLCKNIEKRIGKRKRYLGVPCNHKVHSAWDQDPMFQKSSEHGRNTLSSLRRDVSAWLVTWSLWCGWRPGVGSM